MKNSTPTSQNKINNKEPAKKQTTRVRIGAILIVCFLLIYVPSLLHWMYGKNVRTDILRTARLDDSIEATGYLIRDEQVINCNTKGEYIMEASEGDRLPARARIITILQRDSQNLMESLDKVNLKIIEQQNKKSSALGIFSDDVKKLDLQIDDKVKEIVRLSNSNTFSPITETRISINEVIKKKSSVLGDLILNDSNLNLLYKQKRELENSIKKSTSAIYTQKPGIISYVIDGYENILKPDKINDVPLSTYESISKTSTKRNSLDADNQIAKMIYGIECNLSVIMNEKQASNFLVDDSVKLRINDLGKTIDKAKVVSKLQKPGGKYVIVFSINRFLNETASVRKLSIELVLEEHEGIKVPLSCLFNNDKSTNTADIFIIKANIVYLRKVKIVVKNEEYAIIEGTTDNKNGEGTINLYDYFVCNPENIEEGQIMQQ